MSSSFGSRFVSNWARLKYTGEAELPTREYVGKELLFKSNFLSAKDVYSFIALPNRREFELCFFQETTLRRFLEQYNDDAGSAKWKDWSIESSVSISIVNLVVKFWTGRVCDHDVETYIKRYCTILERPYKPLDAFGIWYGVRKYKVEMKRDDNGQRLNLPSSVSMGPYNGRLYYPGQVTRCFVCNSTDHQVRECKEVKCWRCGSLGHKAKDCQNNAECTLCGEQGHSYFQCPSSYSNRAKAQRKAEAQQQRGRVIELLRSTREVPPPSGAGTPRTAAGGQQEPSASTPRRGGAVSPEAVAMVSSLRPLSEVMSEQAAFQQQQQPSGRGRGRGRGAFAAANLRRAAAAASPSRVGRQQSTPPSCPPEVAAAAETEEAVRQLASAIDNILPPSTDSSAVEEEKEAETAVQRDEEVNEESEYDSASEEPSDSSSGSSGSHSMDSSGSQESPPTPLAAAAEGTHGEEAHGSGSVTQKRQPSPLMNVDKKHRHV